MNETVWRWRATSRGYSLDMSRRAGYPAWLATVRPPPPPPKAPTAPIRCVLPMCARRLRRTIVPMNSILTLHTLDAVRVEAEMTAGRPRRERPAWRRRFSPGRRRHGGGYRDRRFATA